MRWAVGRLILDCWIPQGIAMEVLTGGALSFEVECWKGSIASPLDQTNHNENLTSGTTISTNSITPLHTAELVIAGMGGHNSLSGSATISVDSGFTLGDFVNNGAQYVSQIAYKLQTAAR